MKKLFLASTSTLYGGNYLAYILPELKDFYKGIDEILFIPFARPSGITYRAYTNIVEKAFKSIDIKVTSIHRQKDALASLKKAKGLFVGGGNTFVLVDTLYKMGLMNALKTKIEQGTAYLGTSAGANICGPTMQTTNDMPIVNPPSMKTMSIIPFNLNVHYLDQDLNSTHNGESRETRIKEFHKFNKTPVLGLREGSWLEIKGQKIILKGNLTARMFKKNSEPLELPTNTQIKL